MNSKTAKKLRKKAKADVGNIPGVSVTKHYKVLKKTLKQHKGKV